MSPHGHVHVWPANAPRFTDILHNHPLSSFRPTPGSHTFTSISLDLCQSPKAAATFSPLLIVSRDGVKPSRSSIQMHSPWPKPSSSTGSAVSASQRPSQPIADSSSSQPCSTRSSVFWVPHGFGRLPTIPPPMIWWNVSTAVSRMPYAPLRASPPGSKHCLSFSYIFARFSNPSSGAQLLRWSMERPCVFPASSSPSHLYSRLLQCMYSNFSA